MEAVSIKYQVSSITTENQIFRSRISVLLIIFIAIAVVVFPLLSYFSVAQNNDSNLLFLLFGPVSVVVLMVSVTFGLRYIISYDELTSHILFIRADKIKISDIISIERSYNPIASRAASLKRLLIIYNKGQKKRFVLFSPANEKEFLRSLSQKNPNIKMDVTDKPHKLRFLDWDI